MSRDLAWEGEFYENLAATVASRSAIDATPLIALTRHRMGPELGASQYGDSTFLTDGRDLIVEAQDELADAIAYVVMETQRQLAGDEDHSEVVTHLFETAVYACIAYGRLREAKRARRTT